MILGFQKILPLVLFSRWFVINRGRFVYLVIVLIVVSIVIGLMLIIRFYGYIWVVVGSSMIHSRWILIFRIISPRVLEVYLILYLVFLIIVIWGGTGGVVGL